MPEGLLNQLTLEEIADLFAFLSARRDRKWLAGRKAAARIERPRELTRNSWGAARSAPTTACAAEIGSVTMKVVPRPRSSRRRSCRRGR